VSSTLVKTAVYGNDPNWGRVLAAMGRSGVEVAEKNIDLYIGDICVLNKGKPVPFDKRNAIEMLKEDTVYFDLRINLGTAEATAWGCDMTTEYVIINSEYTT
ncbi:MAG: bifunctional ornithine acetyltransferase/N-acetylglutamate synthase, partial [Dehalococcoidales bacterium]|nr:bifunctional ornithine acetyltransferase/N-acetylglutamate synthase [Dehalococcoidales bacterium]